MPLLVILKTKQTKNPKGSKPTHMKNVSAFSAQLISTLSHRKKKLKSIFAYITHI